MTVTFLTTKPPTLHSGSEVRNFYLLEALRDSKAVEKINLVYVALTPEDAKIKLSDFGSKVDVSIFSLPGRSVWHSLRAYGQSKIPYIAYLQENELEQRFYSIFQESDCIVLSELDAYFASQKTLVNIGKKIKIILDCHNIDYKRFTAEIQSGGLVKKILAIPLIHTLKALEIEALKRADLVLCCSTPDRNYITRYIASEKTALIPNGVKILPLKQQFSDAKTVVFMGLLSYKPNADALLYYFQSMHAQVCSRVPDVKVVIIGKNPPKWLCTLSVKDTRIKVLGFVPDVQEYLRLASVCICPLRSGSGTRLKILEYMASEKAVVSTTIGAEGIDVKNGENIFIADDAINFANALVNMLENPETALKVGKNARLLVSKNYNWAIISKSLISSIQKIF
jgi:polysaccharide biosynthesis protein PslH